MRYRANMKACAKRGGRGALFAARKRLGRKAASNGSWRSLSFVRFLRSRLKTIFVVLVSQASATITGCVRYASYACKKRTPHSRHFRFFRRPSQSTVALQAAKSLPALATPLWRGGARRGVAPNRKPRVRHVVLIIIASIRNEAGFRSQDVRRRRDECHIRHSAVSTS